MRVRIIKPSEVQLISEEENLAAAKIAWPHISGPDLFYRGGVVVEMTTEDYADFRRIHTEWYQAISKLFKLMEIANEETSFYEAEH